MRPLELARRTILDAIDDLEKEIANLERSLAEALEKNDDLLLRVGQLEEHIEELS